MTKTNRYPTIGANPSPYYVTATDTPAITKTDQGYFSVQVFGAQAAFAGPWWIGAQNLAILSNVNLHLGTMHDVGNQDLRSIMQYRSLEKNKAVQLGFSPILVDFMPAKMKKISVSIEYVVDTKNYLHDIAELISDRDLLSTISLAPGASIAARVISSLVGKFVNAVLPKNEREPILQFSGDFDLAVEGLKAGYYVILGSHKAENPLPEEEPKLEVTAGGGLIMNGQPVTQLSYVILKIACVERIRDYLTGHSPWREKLNEARRLVEDYTDDPFVDPDGLKKKEFWEKQCLPLLREASALLKVEPNFLDTEVEQVYRSAYRECLRQITEKEVVRKSTPGQPISAWQPDEIADRKFLCIHEQEDLDANEMIYSEQLFRSRRILKEFLLQ